MNHIPLVHHARRLVREHERGNWFVSDASLLDHLDALRRAYSETRSVVIASALKVEIDRIETLLWPLRR